MKKEYHIYIKCAITTGMLILIGGIDLLAQGPPPPPGVPIDTGVVALIASCVLYGANRMRKNSHWLK